MTFLNVIGYVLMASPFVGLFAWIWWDCSLKVAVQVFLITAALYAVIVLGVQLAGFTA